MVFTYRDEKEGNVGIGKIPSKLDDVLDEIVNSYHIPDKTKTTYHTYYADLEYHLKSLFDKIQYDNFWYNICGANSIMQDVTEMNEIYYSNPKPNFQNTNLYGAAANLIPHRDCILFNFIGINLYRVIIGLTENNDTITNFINLGIEHKMNKGDYMIFDFDKTLHQVKKIGNYETPRIMLKLHYIVCENCRYGKGYVNAVSYFYKYYYYIARYTEQIGTDPTTFDGFFFGLLWEYPFHAKFKYVLLSLSVTSILIFNRIFKIKFENAGKIVLYSGTSLFSIHLIVVIFYYFRFLAVGYK